MFSNLLFHVHHSTQERKRKNKKKIGSIEKRIRMKGRIEGKMMGKERERDREKKEKNKERARGRVEFAMRLTVSWNTPDHFALWEGLTKYNRTFTSITEYSRELSNLTEE